MKRALFYILLFTSLVSCKGIQKKDDKNYSSDDHIEKIASGYGIKALEIVYNQDSSYALCVGYMAKNSPDRIFYVYSSQKRQVVVEPVSNVEYVKWSEIRQIEYKLFKRTFRADESTISPKLYIELD